MAGAVVKYKPEKVDKMMCIAQASALQVLFSAIRVSLPIGGLLWLISSNFLLFELSAYSDDRDRRFRHRDRAVRSS